MDVGFQKPQDKAEVFNGSKGIKYEDTTSLVLKMLVAGGTREDVPRALRAYPELEIEDINQAMQYAAWLVSEQILTPPAA